MSDGLSDSNREMSVTLEIQLAADALADALLSVYDKAFGYPEMTLEIANAALKRAKLKLVPR